MKLAVKILIFLFIAFLATPTIVSLIERKVNTSMFYSSSEEECPHHKEMKEIKAELKTHEFDFFNFSVKSSSLIVSENKSRHDKVTASIFSPPPNV